MCGFAGVFSKDNSVWLSHEFLTSMGNEIAHRGPDGFDVAIDAAAGLGLVHRRLAIVDLTEAGKQPMLSGDGQYLIAFNGEIYNHHEIRALLNTFKSINWRGNSDTETLLEAISFWGLEVTLEKCVGMFAIALWDKANKQLTLIRDRAGEKPLYYGFFNGSLLFGSELKALKIHPLFKVEIDKSAIALMLRHKYIPAPYTVYKNVRKLMPGCMLRINASSADLMEDNATILNYWSFSKVLEKGYLNPLQQDEESIIDLLDQQLKTSIRQQMLADVTVGTFLSGGTDSSLITAVMQQLSGTAVKSFTVGFDVPGYNEATFAKEVSRHLGTDHTEIYVTEKDALNVVPSLPQIYDEPFGDSSQIPTYLICREAKRHVTVALSGDAGDELFAGYSRYFRALELNNKLSKVPGPVYTVLSKLKPMLESKMWQHMDSCTGNSHSGTISNAAMNLALMSECSDFAGLYRHVLSDSKAPHLLMTGVDEHSSVLSEKQGWSGQTNPINWMMLQDSLMYLPDDVLVKVDRASMAVSLETRVPMLDHRFIELASTVPLDMKVRGGQGKWALKQLLYRYVPQELLDRPKTGFGVPIGHWLRNELKDWAEDLLSETRLNQQGLFNTKQVRKYWTEHVSGHRDWQYVLWNILMVQSWLDAQ